MDATYLVDETVHTMVNETTGTVPKVENAEVHKEMIVKTENVEAETLLHVTVETTSDKNDNTAIDIHKPNHVDNILAEIFIENHMDKQAAEKGNKNVPNIAVIENDVDYQKHPKADVKIRVVGRRSSEVGKVAEISDTLADQNLVTENIRTL